MPKMKTHRATAKRVTRTGSGLWKRAKAGKSHLLAHKASKRKRHLRQPTILSAADSGRMARLLPYS
jgi:large subunit ribosomal protein L35